MSKEKDSKGKRALSDLFSADRPIGSRAQDLLDRRQFAESLGEALSQWHGRDSLVVALYGEWGSGKSSIKNMVVEHINDLAKAQDTQAPIVIEFNPWNFAQTDDLTKAFFREVSSRMGKTERNLRRLAAKLREYGGYLTGSGVAIGVFHRYLFIPIILGLAFIVGSSLLAAPIVKWLGIILGGLLLLVAGLLQASGRIVHAVADALSARAVAHEKDLEEHRKEITALLKESERPFLIIMDDIDRLSKEEVRSIVQLVKSNADFPSVIYLLLCQRESIEKSLTESSAESGRAYLEKIVQVAFDVPIIQKAQVEKVLVQGINQALDRPPMNKHLDGGRWVNVYRAGVDEYFKNLRDVYRFLSALMFKTTVFEKGGGFEVNPIDLLVMEVLRLFEPELYQSLPREKSTLTQAPSSLYPGARDDDRKGRAKSLLMLVPEERRERVKGVLTVLFPHLGQALGGAHVVGSDEIWERELRVCHPRFIDRYFALSIPSGDLPQTWFEGLMASAGDRRAVVDTLTEMSERGLLSQALERLESFKTEIDLKHALPFVTALLDVGDDLPEAPPGFFVIDPAMHAVRIIYWYLMREGDIERRGEILKEAIANTKGMFLPVKMVSTEDSDKDKDKDDTTRNLVTKADLQGLRTLCIEKIRAAAQDGRLSSSNNLMYMLYRWKQWGGDQEVRQWVATQTGTPKLALVFLDRAIQTTYSYQMDDYAGRKHRRLRIETISDFIDPETLFATIGRGTDSERSDHDVENVKLFVEALTAYRKGEVNKEVETDD